VWRAHRPTFSCHWLVTQQDISIAEGPRLCQLQAQILFDAVEQRSPGAEDDGIHHDLVFIENDQFPHGSFPFFVPVDEKLANSRVRSDHSGVM
jgi:hypothetical protein